jgi:hypothetical protein
MRRASTTPTGASETKKTSLQINEKNYWKMQCKVKVALCIINKASRHQGVLGSEGIASSSLTSIPHGVSY